MTKAVNLRTLEERFYVGLTPIETVIAAYAQTRGDWNTAGYTRYESRVEQGKYTVVCGDWSVRR